MTAILPATNKLNAKHLAGKLQNTTKLICRALLSDLTALSISISSPKFSAPKLTVKTVVHNADQALYTVKKGSDQYHIPSKSN